MTQFFIGLFGLVALWLALSGKRQLMRYAPIVGLMGQPAWLYFAYDKQAWGLAVLSLAYVGVYLNGIRVQWFKK
jgi:hypothetical protein